jgi:hypothetical protein
VLKALLLIFDPIGAWDNAARRRLNFTFLFYLLPTMAIFGAAEAFGLVKWGRLQAGIVQTTKLFTPGEAALAEIGQLILMLICIFLSAYFIKALGETFHGRHTYKQTLTVVIYGLSPVFLLRLLDMIPNLSLWIPWALGIVLTIKILYHGIPRVMEPDPPHALGLYFMSSLLLTMVTAAERFISIGYLTGKFQPLSHVAAQIADKLHL